MTLRRPWAFSEMGDLLRQNCETCSSFVQLPYEDKPGCHRYPPMVPYPVGPRAGKLMANETAAGITHVVFRGPVNPDCWCREWEPRKD